MTRFITRSGWRRLIGWCLSSWWVVVSYAGDITVAVTFDDPDQRYVDRYDEVISNLAGAAAVWGEHLMIHPNAVLDIDVAFDEIRTANGGPIDLESAGAAGGQNVWQPALVDEFIDGRDRDPDRTEGRITIGFDYMDSILFFDPDPFARTEPVPSDRRDAVTMLTHELGHVFGMSGWRDRSTGEFSGDAASVFDTFIEAQGDFFYFTGENAVEVYGGPVPLTRDSMYHVGNASSLPGDDLRDDVMYGVSSYLGTRTYVSPINIAILDDLGFPLEPVRTLSCDFVGAEGCAIDDINALVSAIVAESSDLAFDLTGDGRVDRLDMDAWRTIAGAENLISGAPYEQGDANLDGMVNLTDFLLWRVVKFSATGGWSRGDFNADGVTDVSDFNIWNDHYTPSLASQVPEPTGALLVILGVSLAVSRLAECRRNHGIKTERTESRLS